MALNQSALDEIAAMLKNGDSFDLVRYGAELLLQALIEAEATAKIGAGRYERTETRSNERNGVWRVAGGASPPGHSPDPNLSKVGVAFAQPQVG